MLVTFLVNLSFFQKCLEIVINRHYQQYCAIGRFYATIAQKETKMAREGKSKVLTLSEFEQILQVAKNSKHAKRNLCLVHFSYGLGLRAKEMASLKIKDVTDGYSIYEEVNLLSHMTKGDKQRTIYLTNRSVRDALLAYLDERKQSKKRPFNLESTLFLSQKGSSFTPDTLQKLFAILYKQANIKGASSHSGRRTFATRLIE